MSKKDITKVFAKGKVTHHQIITGTDESGEPIIADETSRHYTVDVASDLGMSIDVEADNEAQARLMAQEWYEASQEPVNSTEE